jgi:hypothetical protein
MQLTCRVIISLLLILCTSSAFAEDSYRKENVSRTVLSGVRTKLGQNYHINNDCTLADIPPLPVIKSPSHGKIEIVKEHVFPASKGRLEKCNSGKVMGVVAYYTSKPGYSGPDTLVLRTPYGDGKIREMAIKIMVLK